MANITDVKLPDNSQYDLKDNVSGYAKKVAGATTDDLASLTATGDLADSGKKLSDLVLKSNVKDVLNSTSTTAPLSANQGRVLNENIIALENVYGAKNQNVYPYKDTTKTENGVTFTDNGNGTITVSAASYPYTVSSDTTFYCSNFLDNEFEAGTWTLNGSPVVSDDVFVGYVVHYGGEYLSYLDKGQEVTFTQAVDTDDVTIVITLKSGYVLAGELLFKPMIRDARIIDPTFAPYAKTNLQLTNDVASIFDILPNNAGAHNRYRGKALTIDADFWAHISDGTFENQFVGDTITINGRTYILAHANYWLHTGDTACETNHWVVISPNMGNAQMNSDNRTAGGYLGSGFRSGINHDSTPNTALASALATIKSDFGASHILSHRKLLDNAVTGGYPSSGAWVDSEAELMSQIMVYGNRFFDPSTNLGVTIPYLYSIDKSQLALYAQRPDLLTDRSPWWLRDVVSAAHFAVVNYSGYAYYGSASNSYGVRLAFGIKA